MNLCFLLCFLLFVCRSSVTSEEEPMCTKFMYDKQMIETMVRMEVKMDQWDKDRKAFEEHHKEELDEVVRAQNGKLESMIADLNEVRSDVRNMKSDMEKEADDRRQEFLKQNGKIETMIADYNHILDDVRNTTADLENVPGKTKGMPKIAFNAHTSTGGTYSVNQVLDFPIVLLNEGDGYDKSTGKFTAPVSGLYHFTVHVCNLPERYMVASIVHGSKRLAITTQYESSLDSCSSVSAPALVNVGESVFVQSTYFNSMQQADSTYRWPSFSGFLLNE